MADSESSKASTELSRKELPVSELARTFKALSDPTRLRILALLSHRELCVGELEYLLEVSQTNVSRHLDRLRSVGLVSSRKQAQWVHYARNAERFDRYPQLERLIAELVCRASECGSDARALEEYERSGMSCVDLPNCRPGEKK